LTKHRDLLKKTGKSDNSLWLVVIENKSAVICLWMFKGGFDGLMVVLKGFSGKKQITYLLAWV
jgi:hypothetical protein